MSPRPIPNKGMHRHVANAHLAAHGHAYNAVLAATPTPGVYVLIRLCCGERAA